MTETVEQYSGTLMETIHATVVKAEESARRNDLHFENNFALREYLLALAFRILGEANLPSDTRAADFNERAGIARGMIKAAEMIRTEVAEMRRMSDRDYVD